MSKIKFTDLKPLVAAALNNLKYNRSSFECKFEYAGFRMDIQRDNPSNVMVAFSTKQYVEVLMVDIGISPNNEPINYAAVYPVLTRENQRIRYYVDSDHNIDNGPLIMYNEGRLTNGSARSCFDMNIDEDEHFMRSTVDILPTMSDIIEYREMFEFIKSCNPNAHAQCTFVDIDIDEEVLSNLHKMAWDVLNVLK